LTSQQIDETAKNKRQQQLRDRIARIGRIEKMTASASGSVSPGPNE